MKMRVLVVDDNAVNLAAIEQVLKGKYEVIPMITGKRAIKFLYCEKVDLILLDVQMPIMDGVETLREIRNMENGVTVPVIFLTASRDKETVIEGSKLGIMDYITKPFDNVDLLNRIDMVFKRLGYLPINDDELLGNIKLILQDITLGKAKQALGKVDEVLRYQLDEEISGRIRNVKLKLERDEVQAAGSMVIRIIHMLEGKLGEEAQNGKMMINNREVSVKLLYIIDALENFKTKDAIERCHELKQYILSEQVSFSLQKVLEFLVNYDDEEAIKLLKRMVEELSKI